MGATLRAPMSILSGQGAAIGVSLSTEAIGLISGARLAEKLELLCLGFYTFKGFPKVCNYRGTA